MSEFAQMTWPGAFAIAGISIGAAVAIAAFCKWAIKPFMEKL